MKKLFLLGLLTLLSVFSAHAYDFEVDGIYYAYHKEYNHGWEIIDGEVEVAYYKDDGARYSGSVVIPATVTYNGSTYNVTAIGDSAFYECTDLISVTMPESLTSVGDQAFFGCTSFTSVTIPESVTSIGAFAFFGCTSISGPLYNSKMFVYMPGSYSGEYTIPSGIQLIACDAFYFCDGLTSVTIPESVTVIGARAFVGCSGLTSVTIPEGVTEIGRDAFGSCRGLTSVTIPNSVTSIDVYVFHGCTGINSPLYNSKIFAYMPENYSGVYVIPSGIQLIAGGAFYECSGLTEVTIPASVTSIEHEAFGYCSGLVLVTIGESVSSIGSYAFRNCTGLTLITIPESVTTIGPSAFEGCSGLASVTIGESVTTIGPSAFEGCSGLTSVTIPNSVIFVGYRAFGDCSGLTSVTSLSQTPPSYGSSAFDVRDTLYVPCGSKAAYEGAEGWSSFAEIIGIGCVYVTLLVNDETMGSVTGSNEYVYGAEATLTAVPNEGYHFVKWSDENTDNPRTLTVTEDITLTAIFAKTGSNPSDPSDPNNPSNPGGPGEPGGTTANEASLAAAPFAYVQGRTVYLSDNLGEVEAFTATGRRVYRGFDRTITLPQPGVYILRVVADGRRCKVAVR